MCPVADDLTLADRADAAFAEGRIAESLQLYSALLQANPAQNYIWYRTAVQLGHLGEREAAIESLDLVADRWAEEGQLLLASAAAKDLVALNPARGQQRIETIATLYGAGSPRHDPTYHSPPLQYQPERS